MAEHAGQFFEESIVSGLSGDAIQRRVAVYNLDLGREDVIGDTAVPLDADKPTPEIIDAMLNGSLG
jgi:predicted Zn-dependent protease